MVNGSRVRRRIASRHFRVTPYPLPSYKSDVLVDMCPKKCSKTLDKKDWEDATCSVCMECPHNAVLLLCSSHDKGCHPFMCGTSFRYSNCLGQYKKAYTKVNSSIDGQHVHGSINDPVLVPDSSWPVESCEVTELACPLCRGQVKGWTVVEPARVYLNEKKRSCMQDNCSFVGNYKELRKHVKAEHPSARPREVDPILEQKWRRLEREREQDDVISTIRSTMPGAMVFGDYVIESNHNGFDSDEEDGVFDVNAAESNRGFGVGFDSNLVNVFLLLHAFGPSGNDLGRRLRRVGDIVKVGEPPVTSLPDSPSCNPHGDPPILGDCWYNCTLDDISGEEKRARLHKALGQTADWFRRALSVEPVKGSLRLSGYSACGQDGGVQLPREYVEDGVADADLVLFVTTRPTTGNTLAWAVACERDQWGRAIAGHVNVAPRHLTAEAETLLSATLIHEVMHVLGFDPHAFSHFRDERKRRRSQVTKQVMDEKLGRIVTRVVLPRVVMHSRYHYGAFSDNFTGLELEDGGGRGTSGSHWEKRLLMNEIMTGSVDTRSVVSKMTLALLEDSGWYQANYTIADRLDWGYNQGTEFVTLPCNLWKGAYHCNTTQSSGCTYNREAEGYCPIVSYSGDLPQWARYFPLANKGGQSSLADYCTYFVAYSDGSCTDTNGARAPDRMLGEVRGSSSRCLSSSLVRTGFVRGSITQGNGCYQHRCINNSLEVAVDGMWKVCPEGGGPIQFPGFNGELICPEYHELCSTGRVLGSGHCPDSCHFNGDCVDGRCRCFLGFHGHDCSKRFCPGNCNGHGQCLSNGICECENDYTGVDCSTAICNEQCSLHGGVCDNGVCEFRCSDYAGYTCQNSSMLTSSLLVCKNVLESDLAGQHCAPSEPSILQQLEEVVVMPNYHRLFPGGARKLFNFFGSSYCDAAAKRLACWISIQKCDNDGDNRLRVCHSACQSYNLACGASLDCSDQTLFSSEEETEGQCTGSSEMKLSLLDRMLSVFYLSNNSWKGRMSVKSRQR